VLNLPSGLVVNLETDPSVTAADLEDALKSETSVPGFLIERTEIAGRAQFSISIQLPASAIVEQGGQKLDAVTTLRAVADALAKVNVGR
jgi:hypothetical protein